MMFERFFKPKWQHASPSVRLAALSRFDPADAGLQRILATLALEDPDSAVRSAALSGVVMAPLLVEVMSAARSASAVEAAIVRFWEVVSPVGVEPLLAIVSAMPTPLRLQLSLAAPTASLAEPLVGHFDADEDLARLALELPFAALRQQAALSLVREEVLDRVARESKTRDKGVYRIVRDKLETLRTVRQQQREAGHIVDELCAALQAHARMPVDPLYAARFQHLVGQWSACSKDASSAQTLAWQQAFERCREKLSAVEADALQADAYARARAAAIAEREAACLQLEEALKQLSFNAPLALEDLPALAGLVTTQRNRWNAAGPDFPPDHEEQVRFKRVLSALEQLQSAGAILQRHADAIDAAADRLLESPSLNVGELESLHRALLDSCRDLTWPEGVRRPEVLEKRDRAVAHHDALIVRLKAEEESQVAAVAEGLEGLRQEISRGHLKAAQQLLRDQQLRVKTLPMRRAAQFQNALRDLAREVNELRDWQGFATLPKKTQLCEDMEALVGIELAPDVLAGRVRRLQEQWKLLGAGDGDQGQALWERFSRAADAAYEPCRGFFAEQAKVREANLTARTALVTDLATYLEQGDWTRPDWKAAQEILEAARQQWRYHSPVDRRAGESLQTRFEALMADLHARIQQGLQGNADARRRMVEEVERLVQGDDLHHAIERVKQLQRDWKQVGPVAKRDDHVLWRQFRAACDAIFARRSQHQADQMAVHERMMSEMETLCAAAEALPASADPVAAQRQLAELQGALDALEALPRDVRDNARRRCRAVSEQLAHAVREVRSATRRQQQQQFWEALAQVDALEAGRIAGQEDGPREPEWDRLEGGERVQALKRRWQRLAAMPDVVSGTAEALQRICLRLEMAADLESPAEDAALRRQLQVELFNSGQGRRERAMEPGERVERMLVEWMDVGPVDIEMRHRLTARLRALVKEGDG